MAYGKQQITIEDHEIDGSFFPAQIGDGAWEERNDLNRVLSELPPFETSIVRHTAEAEVATVEVDLKGTVHSGYTTTPNGSRHNDSGASVYVNATQPAEDMKFWLISGSAELSRVDAALARSFDRRDILKFAKDAARQMSFDESARWIGKLLHAMFKADGSAFAADDPLAAEEYLQLIGSRPQSAHTTITRLGKCAVRLDKPFIETSRVWQIKPNAADKFPSVTESQVTIRDGHNDTVYSFAFKPDGSEQLSVVRNAYSFTLTSSEPESEFLARKHISAMDRLDRLTIAKLERQDTQEILAETIAKMVSVVHLAVAYSDELVVLD